MGKRSRTIPAFFGQKKALKVGGANVSREVKEALAMEKPRMPVITMTVKGRDNKKTIKTTSNTKNGRYNKPMSLRQIMDIMCPIFSYKRIGYGNSWMDRHGSTHPTNYFNTSGTSVALKWLRGKQAWQEYVALPMHNFGGHVAGHTDKFVYDGFGASVSQLIGKAYDVRNDEQNRWFSRTSGTSSTLNTTQNVGTNEGSPSNVGGLMKTFGLIFDYHGGYQEHVWTNYTEGNVFMELWECQPRDVIAGYGIDPVSGTHFKTLPIHELVSLDYRALLPLANEWHPYYNDSGNGSNVDTDHFSDCGFRINKDSNMTHTRYLVSKPVTVTLKPGDRFKHRVVLDPFNFTESMFNLLERRKFDTQSTTFDPNIGAGNNNFLPMLIPQFTKHICVRAINEIGIVRATATSDDIQGSGHTAGQLSHTCTEYHKCRMIPAQKPKQHFIDNNLSDQANYLMDSLNNEMSLQDHDGLAAVNEL
jgi:hypothetical protein